jgi:uncharacterized protein HemY
VSRAAAVTRQASAVLASVPAVLVGVSWHALAGILLAAVLLLVTLCWIIASNSRTRRVATLIRAWRGTTTPATRAGPAPARRRSDW